MTVSPGDEITILPNTVGRRFMLEPQKATATSINGGIVKCLVANGGAELELDAAGFQRVGAGWQYQSAD